MIKIRITWPLLALLAAVLFAWLIREPAASVTPVSPRKASRPRPRSTPPRRNGHRPFIVETGAADGSDPATMTYADALRTGGYSADELSAIADREAYTAGQQAASDPTDLHGLDRLRNRKEHTYHG